MGQQGEGDHVVNMVRTALRLGYRHIDTVSLHNHDYNIIKGDRKISSLRGTGCKLWYIIIHASANCVSTRNAGDEISVGQGIRESGIPRSEIYVTTKLA